MKNKQLAYLISEFGPDGDEEAVGVCTDLEHVRGFYKNIVESIKDSASNWPQLNDYTVSTVVPNEFGFRSKYCCIPNVDIGDSNACIDDLIERLKSDKYLPVQFKGVNNEQRKINY